MRTLRLVLLAWLVTVLAACVGPTVRSEAMHTQASLSAESAVSALETMRLVVQAQPDGKTPKLIMSRRPLWQAIRREGIVLQGKALVDIGAMSVA